MPIFPSFFVNKTGAYEIEQSLRFDGSAYLTRGATSSGGGNTFTISYWTKQGDRNLYAGVGQSSAFMSTNQSAPANVIGYSKDPEANLYYSANWGTGSTAKVTNAKYRDTSAWQHHVWQFSSSNSNYIDLYVNGVLQSYSQNDSITSSGLNSSSLGLRIGAIANLPYNPYSGYLAEFVMADGSALPPTDFGEFDDNGVWRPIDVSGLTFGNNGFYLTFDPSATNGIGHDHSGNGNHWTATGFTTSGTGTDVMSDTPTTNWATLNPLDRFKATNGNFSPALSEGNLKLTGNGPQGIGRSTIAMSSGKFYFETTITSIAPDALVGIYKVPFGETTVFWQQETQATYYSGTGVIQYPGNTTVKTYSTYTTGDIIGVALDLDNGKVFFSKNGTWQGSSDPAAGTNPAVSGLTGEWTFGATCGGSSGSTSVNFGQRAFAYTPPTGFKALNTSNLPAPDIADGSDYFNTSLWTGTGSPVAVTGVGFQPDLVWVKARSRTADHKLQDSVRGSFRYLQSNLTNAENTNSGNDWFRSFDSDGFTVAQYTTGGTSTSEWAGNGDTYVGWSWLAANGTSSNTDGSITSTVSANQTAGFSIVSYTGTGANATVGHGLGVAISMMIIKNRDATSSWQVYHSALGPTKVILLESTSAAFTSSVRWNDTAPTSTVFTIGTDGGMNGNGNDHIAYCFAEVEGYSKFGSYTGNGSSDGPFVYLGFRPALLILKRSDSSGAWFIHDTTRDPYNVVNHTLVPDQNLAEQTPTDVNFDFLSNGFKYTGSNGSISDRNASGGTYVYMALAENPFGGSGVSPATAR